MKYFWYIVFLLITVLLFIFFIRIPKRVNTIYPSPTVGIRADSGRNTAVRISSGEIPNIPLSLPRGFVIHTFATKLGSPRDLQFSPDGTLLVSNPGAGQIIALPDKNGDGVADSNKIVISGENHPHGLGFHSGKLYVADVDKVVRYNWDESTLTATKDKNLFALPQNNNHNNRTLVFDKAGNLFVSVGSRCNVCREDSPFSATILISDFNGNNPRVFAKGLRNAPFIRFNPNTGELWGTEMGRDFLGDNLPPDEINILREGKNYGWPDCFGNKIPDVNFNQKADCQNTEPPIFEIPAHSAPLGLSFINSPQFPSDWQGDLLVAYHGSWNRTTATGYKVVRMDVDGNKIVKAEDFLTGFILGTTIDSSLGRPVDLEFDSEGNLYISDDRAGNIYIIQKVP